MSFWQVSPSRHPLPPKEISLSRHPLPPQGMVVSASRAMLPARPRRNQHGPRTAHPPYLGRPKRPRLRPRSPRGRRRGRGGGGGPRGARLGAGSPSAGGFLGGGG